MRSQGKKDNGFDMKPALVTSIDPISIQYDSVAISSGIYCNEVFSSNEKLEDILQAEEYISDSLKEFLNTLYRRFKLEVGDIVIVQRTGNEFYILGKAVKN